MAEYSRGNGWLGAAAAVGLFTLTVLEGLDGFSPLALMWGFLGIAIGLQALDDLVWRGRQEAVVLPLQRVAFGLTILAALWGVATWLT